MSQLRQFLAEMNRPDAINIIDKALEKSEGSLAEGEGTSSSSQMHMGKSAPGEYMHDGGRGGGRGSGHYGTDYFDGDEIRRHL